MILRLSEKNKNKMKNGVKTIQHMGFMGTFFKLWVFYEFYGFYGFYECGGFPACYPYENCRHSL